MSVANKYKNICLCLICFLFVLLFVFFVINGYINLDKDVRMYSADAKDMMAQRTAFLLFEINIFPQNVGDELLFLSELSSLQDVVSYTGKERRMAIEKLGEDFLNYIEDNVAYYQLKYVDETGQEIVRAEFDGKNYEIISEDQLKNEFYKDYFGKTIKLSEGENYVSPLELNIENGVMENRGSKESPSYVPTIIISTPVFSGSNLKGVVMMNVYANYFLDIVRYSQREGDVILLVNKEGYYLAHPKREKEFAFMFGKKEGLYYDYPEIPKEILLDPTKRNFESEEFIFSFRHIYPTIKNYKFSEDYSWILVTISDKSQLDDTLKNFKKDYLYCLFFVTIIILIILILIFLVTFWIGGGKAK